MGNTMMQASSAPLIAEIKYDSKGNLIKQDVGAAKSGTSGDYNCPEISGQAAATDPMMAMMGGGGFDMSAMLGGVGQQVTDLTKRVLKAAVDADKIIEETSIYLSTNGTMATKDGSGIDACTKVAITDTAQYVACSKSILNRLLLVYQNAKGDAAVEKAKENLKKNAGEIINTLNAYSTINTTCPANLQDKNCCGESTVIIIDTKEKALTCVLNITTRLNKLQNPSSAGSSSNSSGGNTNNKPTIQGFSSRETHTDGRAYTENDITELYTNVGVIDDINNFMATYGISSMVLKHGPNNLGIAINESTFTCSNGTNTGLSSKITINQFNLGSVWCN
jgi:hypothetical protein